MLLAAIGGTGAPRTVTMELANYFGGEAGPARFHAKAGQVMVARRQIQFDIAESGKVENCRDYHHAPIVHLDFNEKGAVSACTLEQSSGSPGIDKVACQQVSTVTLRAEKGKAPESRSAAVEFVAGPAPAQ